MTATKKANPTFTLFGVLAVLNIAAAYINEAILISIITKTMNLSSANS
jgi:hypothetical protein